MYQRIKAIFNKDTGKLTAQQWVDFQYAKEIRRKHVSIAALCFSGGSMFPAALSFGLTGDLVGAALCGCVSLASIAMAIPELRKLERWSAFDRVERRETYEAWAECSADYKALLTNYYLASAMLIDDKPAGHTAHVINFSKRTDH